MPQQALGGSSFIHEHVIQPAALLNSTEVEKLAHKEGTRRTVYFTKQVDDPNKKTSGEGAYRRTGQYLGEWHANEFDGKGVYERANGTRYVGGWQAGLVLSPGGLERLSLEPRGAAVATVGDNVQGVVRVP